MYIVGLGGAPFWYGTGSSRPTAARSGWIGASARAWVCC